MIACTQLQQCGPAHTDSDISLNFVEADVFHVADTWWNGVYPFIDYSTGGSIDGQIRAAQRNVAAVTASDNGENKMDIAIASTMRALR
jgi:hypothetical protein